MRVTADGKSLVSALQWGSKGFNKALGENTSGYVVSLKVDGNTLSVSSYDTAYYFKADVAVTGAPNDQSKAVQVNGPDIVNVAKVLGAGFVTIDFGENSVTFIHNSDQYAVDVSKLKVARPNDLPPIVGRVNFGSLKAAANDCVSIAATDGSIPVLASVLLEYGENGVLRLQSTDRFIMGVRDIDYVADENLDEESKVAHNVVPAVQLRKLISDISPTEDVEIRANDTYFGISGGNFEGYVTVQNVDPVGYKRMFERVETNKINFKTSEFKTALNKITTMSHGSNIVILELSYDDLTIYNESKKSKAKVNINAVELDVSDDPDDIGEFSRVIKINSAMLGKVISQVKTAVAEMSFVETTRNITFRETDSSGIGDPTFFNTVMATR